jgi:hypothetical protein
MHAALLFSLVLVSQAERNPSMEFRNATGGQTVTIWIWCYSHGNWANNSQPVVLNNEEARRVELHTGNFRVYARNQQGVSVINERVLLSGEIDRIRVETSAPVGAATGLAWAEDQPSFNPTMLERPNARVAPAMEFRNDTGGQTISIWIYCYGQQRWEGVRQPVVIPPDETRRLALHTGNFRLYIRNGNNFTEIKERVLAAGELDQMTINRYSRPVGDPPGMVRRAAPRRRYPDFVVNEGILPDLK